ncbi:MAG: hypothetical protein AAFX87_26530 [Bacteroidota bacterium]
MEKSIESIWKKGFLDSEALVAPKVNNLYNRKSKTIIEKLNRMMKVNIYAILIFASLNMVLYAVLGTPFAGIFILSLSMWLCWVSVKKGKNLKAIDTSLNSYDYLKAYDNWLKTAISGNVKMMRFLYPLIFLASLMPIVHALKVGEATSNAIANSGFHLTYGIPTFAWVIAIAIAILIYAFGGKIYNWDLNMVYGRVFRKLETMIVEMEELRN